MSDSIFGLLTGNAHFDKGRFREDIGQFSKVTKHTKPCGRLQTYLNSRANTSNGSTKTGLYDKESDANPQALEKDSKKEKGSNTALGPSAVRLSGPRCPAALTCFEDLAARHACSHKLLQNLAQSGFQEPTAVQKNAIPTLLARQDVYAIAPTGSGKTLAFLLPSVMLSMQDKASEKRQGPSTLVLNPTRELAAQSMRVLKLVLPGSGVKGSLLAKSTAAGTDFAKVDILIATPLLLVECIQSKKVELSRLRLFVLDEADKLFEEGKGFLEQIDAIFASARAAPALTRALFSATLPDWVRDVAGSVLQQPSSIIVGSKNAASTSVRQSLLFVGQEEGKLVALKQLVAAGLKPPVLVFVASKERAKALHKEVMYQRIHADCIHADQTQAARSAAVTNFRAGKTWLLIATDLMARGMDFLGVQTVINYDFPATKTDYIHRIGRTGRGGNEGAAVTLFTEADAPRLQAIATCMRKAGCDVPDWMLLIKRGQAARLTAPVSARSAYEHRKQSHKKQIVQQSKEKKRKQEDALEAIAPATGSNVGKSKKRKPAEDHA